MHRTPNGNEIETPTPWQRTLRTPATVAASAGIALSCNADVVSVGGQATLIARPADARLGALEDNSTAFVWNEAQGVELAGPVTIDAFAPGQYRTSADFEVDTLPAGSMVSSHLIHFDPIGSQSRTVIGSVTFGGDILGAIAWNRPGGRHLGDSDAVLGLGTLLEYGRDLRGVFDVGDGSVMGQDDSFTISADRRTLTFELTAAHPYDQIRVITVVPAPPTLFLLAGVGLVAGRRRR